MKRITYISCFLLLLSCTKESEVNPIPHIEFVDISPEIAQEYTDEINITIRYTDEDGDLGENDPDIKNLFVRDVRNGIQYEYRIPQLSPNNNDIHITGNFNILINGTGITNGNSTQKVSYEVYVIDRNQNESNTIETSEITINQ